MGKGRRGTTPTNALRLLLALLSGQTVPAGRRLLLLLSPPTSNLPFFYFTQFLIWSGITYIAIDCIIRHWELPRIIYKSLFSCCRCWKKSKPPIFVSSIGLSARRLMSYVSLITLFDVIRAEWPTQPAAGTEPPSQTQQ